MLNIRAAKGSEGPLRSLKRHKAIVKGSIRRTLMNHRVEISNDVVRMMNAPKSGETYLVYKSKKGRRLKRPRKHVASARGEPMANMTGETLRSLAFRITGYHKLTFGFGTVQGAIWERHAQRRVLSLAMAKNSRKLELSFENNIMDDIKRVVKGGKI